MRRYTKLTREVSISEMLEMRDRGMTNKEIAQSLDVSYQTVLNHIGKMPRDMPDKSEDCKITKLPYDDTAAEVEVAADVTDPIVDDDAVVEVIVEDESPEPTECEHDDAVEPACYILVEDRRYDLLGTFANYSVSTAKKELLVKFFNNTSVAVSFDKISDFINELSTIDRKIKDMPKDNEVW